MKAGIVLAIYTVASKVFATTFDHTEHAALLTGFLVSAAFMIPDEARLLRIVIVPRSVMVAGAIGAVVVCLIILLGPGVRITDRARAIAVIEGQR